MRNPEGYSSYGRQVMLDGKYEVEEGMKSRKSGKYCMYLDLNNFNCQIITQCFVDIKKEAKEVRIKVD